MDKKPNWLSFWAHLRPYSSQQARMFPRDAASPSRRAASMYDDYYDYDYGHGLEAIRQAAAAIPVAAAAYGTKAKIFETTTESTTSSSTTTSTIKPSSMYYIFFKKT